MSAYSNVRAAANADRRLSAQQQSDKSRVASTAYVSDRPKDGIISNGERRLPPRESIRSSLQAAKRNTRPRDEIVASGYVPSSKRGLVDSPRSWDPQATLQTSSTAPLASRVSIPPLSSSAPKELQPHPLTDLTLVEQEHAVMEDLLFIFMGFEGQYIRFVNSYNPLEERERLTGPDFRISPGLDPSLRDLAQSMLRMAKHYIALEAFIEVQSRREFGTVNHALCAAIRTMLKDYLTLIAQLEHQLLTNDAFTLNVLNLHTKPTTYVLAQLYRLAQEILRKNSILEEDLDDSDDMDNVDDIIEQLREGGDARDVGGRKVCKGGSVLGLITDRLGTMSGDPAARTVLTTLLREASRPYMTMLNEWLHHGSIRDPHGEFLIREQRSIKREGLEQDYTDEYWEKRYTVRESDVPPQLAGVKDKVLLAGKYLNVVRECGGVDISAEVHNAPVSFDDPRFLDNVNDAYANANTSLLSLLLTTHGLPARLRSLKHYFFLDRSDFFTHFLELSNSELRKPARAVNTSKLQSLLDLVLRQPGSVAAEDPFKEDVKVCMNEITLTNWLMRIVNVTGLDADAANTSMTHLFTPAPTRPASTLINAPGTAPDSDDKITGFDALVLDYAVPFPLSLVISRVTLTRYQLLFRYLLSLRHLETLLTGAWTEHAKAPSWRHRAQNPKIELWKRKAWTLRARMLVFVQQLLYFCTSEVIEPNWCALMARLSEREEGEQRTGSRHGHGVGDAQSRERQDTTGRDGFDGHAGAGGNGNGNRSGKAKRTVDELMQDHVDFLATCLKECMLTNSKLLRINAKVTSTCTMFAIYTHSLTRHLHAADPSIPDPSSSSSTKTSSTKQHTTNPQNSNTAMPAPSIPHDPKKLDSMIETLDKYEYHFSRHLKMLLDMLNYLAATETVVFLGLCARLSAAGEGVGGVFEGEGEEK